MQANTLGSIVYGGVQTINVVKDTYGRKLKQVTHQDIINIFSTHVGKNCVNCVLHGKYDALHALRG